MEVQPSVNEGAAAPVERRSAGVLASHESAARSATQSRNAASRERDVAAEDGSAPHARHVGTAFAIFHII